MTINARASQLSSGSGVGPAARRPATAPSGAWESRPAFLFTGHGSQYKGMAEGLFEAHPVFREAIERCDGILGEELKPGLLDVLYGSPEARSLIHQSAYANPAFFALEYALARLWMSWGVTPACVVGHSVGEYAAACIAAVNAPGSVVVSGDRAAIGRLQSEFEREGVRAVRLNVSQAFHSPMMAPILDELREAAGSVRFNAPGIPYVSALTGSLAYNEVRQAGYWVEHFSEPVRFLDAMRSLFTLNPTDFIEIGPASELLRIGRQCDSNGQARASNGQGRDAKWIPSLGPDGGDCEIIGRSRSPFRTGCRGGPARVRSAPYSGGQDRRSRSRPRGSSDEDTQREHPSAPTLARVRHGLAHLRRVGRDDRARNQRETAVQHVERPRDGLADRRLRQRQTQVGPS